MRLKITHLKAPWPCGARVGDVIELPAVPAWAAGKCEPAPEGADVTLLTDEQRDAIERERAAEAEEQRRQAEEQAQREADQREAERRQREEEEAREAEEQRLRDAAAAEARAAEEAAAARAAAEAASTVTGDGSGTPLPPIDPAAAAPGAVELPAAEAVSAPARKAATTRRA